MIGLRDTWADHAGAEQTEMVTSLGNWAGVEFFLNSDKLSGKRLFLVRFPKETGSEAFNNVLFRSLVIQMLEFELYKELTFVILKSELEEIFISFAEDLIFQTSSCNSPDEVLETVSNVIFQWLKLFERAVPNFLSSQAEKGLFGELYLFRTLLWEDYAPRDLEAAWEGPLWGDRDFSFPTAKLEIKLSSAKNPTLKITSERQLEVLGDEREFIILYQVDVSRSVGDLLTDLIDEIRIILASDLSTLERFNMKLLAYGYSDDERTYYDKRFSVRKASAYQITDGFPCITPATLMPGIFNVGYEIDLSVCEPYKIEYSKISILINGY